MGRSPIDVVRSSDRRVVLSTRAMKTVRLDLTEGGEGLSKALSAVGDCNGAVVRIVARYGEGNAEAADTVLARVRKALEDAGAFFIRRPERIVIPRSSKRIEEISHEQDPMEAARIWVEKKAPTHVDREEVLRKIEEAYRTSARPSSRLEPRDLAIRSVKTTDAMPFCGECSLEGIPDGVIGVIGRNGAGKSAFLDCVRFGFYGATRDLGKRGQGAIVHKGADRMFVELGVEVGADTHVVGRGISAKGSGTLEIDGDKVGPAAGNPAIVEGIVGMGKEDFFRSAFVAQGELERVLRRSSGDLKADIVRWLDLGVWSEMEILFGDEVKVLGTEIQKTRVRISVFDETVADGAPGKDEIQAARDDLDAVRAATGDREEAARLVRALRGRLKTARALASAVETASKKSEAETVIAGLEAELVGIVVTFDAVSKRKWAAQEELDRCRKTARDGFDGVCPVDREECPRTLEINECVDKARVRLEKASEIVARLVEEARPLSKKRADLVTRVERERTVVAEAMVATRMVSDSGPCENPGNVLVALQAAEVVLDCEIPDSTQVVEADRRLSELLARKLAYEEAVAKREAASGALGKMEGRLREKTYLRHVCSNLGIPSMLIESALGTVTAQVNTFLESVGLGILLEFSAEREIQRKAMACVVCGEPFGSGDKVCGVCKEPRKNEVIDELTPMVREGNLVYPLELAGGSGRGIVSLATRVAFAKLQGATVLFLDEVTGMLDEENLRLMVRVIRELPKMGFRQVFVITHQREVSDVISVNIEVVKYSDENRSEFVWAVKA